MIRQTCSAAGNEFAQEDAGSSLDGVSLFPFRLKFDVDKWANA